ncbi:hypothetical protein L0U85_12525 [Glycomyces sp. L485]|uniref:hypothetical protein n=1 Tax=Glycomyces sp. L485 TaxID=2909235 RepID=UPI001F4BB409|nr:hypothetical protein [Glycomyces sp. L485]MCH7231669.1 hypothetical protein [Glycomyces sp. L485]
MRILRSAGLAAIGVAALTACSNLQGAAMYVGDERVPEATVDGLVDQVVDVRAEQGEDLAIHDYTGDRQQAVVFLLYTELGREIGLEAPDTSGAANEFDALYMEASGYYSDLSAQAEPRPFTEGELAALDEAVSADQQLLQSIVEEWVASSGLTEEEINQLFTAAQSDPAIIQEIVRLWSETTPAQTTAGFADDLAGYVEEYDIAVNPRYGEIDLSPLPGVFEVEIPQR